VNRQERVHPIFYHNEQQKRLAEASRDREGPIYTAIVPQVQFCLAQAYHQKYRLQQVPALLRELRAIYPPDDEFAHATAAARVNGYPGGYGSLAALQAGLEDVGLSPAARQNVLDLASAIDGQSTCEVMPTFTWSPAGEAQSYAIQVDTDPDFPSPGIDTTTPATEYTHPAPLPFKTFYWRVRTTNLCGTSSWSPAWTVTYTACRWVYLPVVVKSGP
jgi:peptide-methionine (S)-S-oxide reductase